MITRKSALTTLVIVSAHCLPHATHGQDGNDTSRLAIHRLEHPITFDGRVDATEWGSVTPAPLTQYEPIFKGPIMEETELRVAYDDRFIYVSCVCRDSKPTTRMTYRRDNWDSANDQIAIMLDSYDDYENGVIFVLYATGARIDSEFFNDARQTSDVNTDWNTYWDGRVVHEDWGWSGEMRIPLSGIRFQTDEDGRTRMGMSLYRHIARNQTLYSFPEMAPNWGFWSFVKPSKSERVVFEGLEPKRPLYIAPYIIGGISREAELSETETEWLRSRQSTYDAGLDMKYGITSNLTMDLTVNTDFAQIEADNQEVNLTRFSLFFPEKRQFFLERTSNFDFGFGNDDRLFYSRRIGIVDGALIPLIGGVRLVGRIGESDVGVLSMQSARTNSTRSENFSVVRLKKQVLNKNSYVGGIGTTRVDEGGSYNVAFGLDGTINVAGDDYLILSLAQTLDSNDPKDITPLDRLRGRAMIQRARETGLGFEAGAARSGSAYDPGVGFQARSDFWQLFGVASFGIRPPETSPIQRHLFSVGNDAYFRNSDNVLETNDTELSWIVGTREGYLVTVSSRISAEDLVEGFDLSDDAGIPAGRYRYASGSIEFEMPEGFRLRTKGEVAAGSFYDGNLFTVSVSPVWSVSPNLQFTGSWSFNRASFSARDVDFVAHIVQGRVDYALNTRFSLSTFVQFSSADNIAIGNLRFRYNPKDGNDFFLVFNDGYNTTRGESVPLLPVNTGRTVLAKYTRTFGR